MGDDHTGSYVRPTITELGTLDDLTKGALDTGGNDALFMVAIDKSAELGLGTEQISY